MGGRGAASSQGMSQQSLEKRMSALSAKMVEYAPYTMSSYRGDDKEQKRNEYFKVQRQFNDTRNKLNEMQNKQRLARQAKKEVDLEMKHRDHVKQRELEVTSSTYERAKKRTQKNVNSWFGRGM